VTLIGRGKLWTPTGGLYAIAAGLIVLAVATGNSIFSHRYEFASPMKLGGDVLWRGDTVTGEAVLCASDALFEDAKKASVTLPYKPCH
jgi:hypothetical protein